VQAKALTNRIFYLKIVRKMKPFIYLILLLLPAIAYTQANKLPKYFVNGNEVNFDYVFINPTSIGSINVKRENPNGEIYIMTKEMNWKYKSLEKFLRSFHNYKQIYEKSISPIFIIDKRVIDDPDSVQIDSSYFGEATLKILSNVKGVTDGCKQLVIVYIELAKQPIIHIRGESFIYPDTLKN
jgi:hypothetical protein